MSNKNSDLLDCIRVVKKYDKSIFDEFNLLCFMEELDDIQAEVMISEVNKLCPQLADSLTEVFLLSRDLLEAEYHMDDIGSYTE